MTYPRLGKTFNFSCLEKIFNFSLFSAAAAGGPAGPEGGQCDLRSSVNNLLEAMQNLLGGLHLPEIPQDDDADDDDDDGDDDVNWQ